jgi:hypothetical protein
MMTRRSTFGRSLLVTLSLLAMTLSGGEPSSSKRRPSSPAATPLPPQRAEVRTWLVICRLTDAGRAVHRKTALPRHAIAAELKAKN